MKNLSWQTKFMINLLLGFSIMYANFVIQGDAEALPAFMLLIVFIFLPILLAWFLYLHSRIAGKYLFHGLLFLPYAIGINAKLYFLLPAHLRYSFNGVDNVADDLIDLTWSVVFNAYTIALFLQLLLLCICKFSTRVKTIKR